jgi:hypothetical protein
MKLTYTVRLGSLAGDVLGTYRHPGPDEPKRRAMLSPDVRLEGGSWRDSDYVQTDASAPAKNVLIVERIDQWCGVELIDDGLGATLLSSPLRIAL